MRDYYWGLEIIPSIREFSNELCNVVYSKKYISSVFLLRYS